MTEFEETRAAELFEAQSKAERLSNEIEARGLIRTAITESTEHYERLLSKHYTWMFGASFDERVQEQQSFLFRALEPLTNKPVRCPRCLAGKRGPGFQTIALAQASAFLRSLQSTPARSCSMNCAPTQRTSRYR